MSANPRVLVTRHGVIRYPTYIPVTTFGEAYPLDKLIQQSTSPSGAAAPGADPSAARQSTPPAPEPTVTLDPSRSREALRNRERAGQ